MSPLPHSRSSATEMKTRTLHLWLWTLEAFSFALVLACWVLLFSGHTWGSKLGYPFVFAGSFPTMALLFVTAVFSLRRQRGHAIFCFAIFLAWLAWALLPRP